MDERLTAAKVRFPSLAIHRVLAKRDGPALDEQRIFAKKDRTAMQIAWSFGAKDRTCTDKVCFRIGMITIRLNGVKPEELVKFDYKFKKEDLERLVNNNKSSKLKAKKTK